MFKDNISNPELHLMQILETESASTLEVSDKSRIYEIVNIISGYKDLAKIALTSVTSSVDFLKGKYIDRSAGSTKGYLLLNSQHELILDQETSELMHRDLLSLVINTNAAAVITYEVLFESERDGEKMNYLAVQEALQTIGVKYLDHIDLDILNLEFDSAATLGLI